MHKRKSSKEDDHSQLALASPPSPPSTNGNTNGSMNSVDGHRPNPAPRTRTISTPVGLSLVVQPPSTTTPTFPNAFPLPSPTSGRGPPSTLRPGHRAPSSPLHASFSMPGHKPGQAGHGHGRNSSMSASSSFYSPPSPSPLSSSFPSSSNSFGPARPPPHSHSRSGSYAGPPTASFPLPESGPHPPSPTGTIPSSSSSASVPSTSTTTTSRRHHARLHSRNLSVFFPRPGQQQQPTITEDDAPDTESNHPYPTPVSPIPPASPSPRLGEGFTFGARPPPDALDSSSSSGLADDVNGGATARKSRRGHHHKHSMSHNFFSFLEPGSQPHAHGRKPSVSANGQQGQTWDPDTAPQDLHAHAHRAPSPSLSPAPLSASLSTSSRSTSTAPFAYAGANDRIPPAAALASLATFALGAWMWVVGQQVGSLACTGLGYWIVFDALGVGVGRILPVWLRRPGMVSPLGRPYGNARVESVALFAQGVYLMFSAVYVFKETVEHLLLSAGEGHHHHPGDEDVELLGIEFPLHLLFFAFLGLCANSFLFDNNARLVSITGIRLPPLSTLLDPSGSRLRYATTQRPEPSTPLGRLAENPFSAVAVALALVIAGVCVLVPASEHRACDLVLAAVEAVSMGMLAYPLCVAIGTVLLQTAPARGTASGRTETFLRAMREIERHKDVQHLPPPHVWQLTPHEHSPSAPQQPLVVALELRVSRDLDDARVLALARWAAGRCGSSLGLSEREAEEWVTVGITRG